MHLHILQEKKNRAPAWVSLKVEDFELDGNDEYGILENVEDDAFQRNAQHTFADFLVKPLCFGKAGVIMTK